MRCSIKTIKEKFDFINKWLEDGGSPLNQLKWPPKRIWIASGKDYLSQAKKRMLSQKGIVFGGEHLTIDKKLL